MGLSAQVAAQVDSLVVEDISSEIDFGHLEQRRIHTIIIHSNYFLGDDPYSTEGCIAQFRQYDVAPHYLIERDGNILRLVDEEQTAFHAGDSRIPGTNTVSLNQFSIGIEIINTQKEGPTEAQYDSLVRLVRDICSRRPIKHILRHSDVSPGRKTDPWCFDWEGFIRRL